MTTLTCTECGFDSARWTAEDLERTLAHSDDLLGHVLHAASDAVVGDVSADRATDEDDAVRATHHLMHRLHDLAELRRTREQFVPMSGDVRSLQISGGGVPKASVASAVVGPSGLHGDVQRTRRHHGRPWQAVCLFSAEVLGELAAEGHPIVAGSVGENVTVGGVDWSRIRGGLTITIGDVVLVTSTPAAPCSKIAACFLDRRFERIDHATRPGSARWYASVRAGGTIRPGDAVTVTA